MDAALEILTDALKKYAAEIIAAGLAFVTFRLWHNYRGKIISGIKFLMLFILALITGILIWLAARYPGGMFILGFGSAAIVGALMFTMNKFRSGKAREAA